MYLLLQLILAVVDHNGVVMPIQPVDQSLDTGLVQVTDVGSGLPRFLIEQHELRVDGSESVDDYLALNGLDRVDHHGHGTLVQLLEALRGQNG